jgi:hypothetical protein
MKMWEMGEQYGCFHKFYFNHCQPGNDSRILQTADKKELLVGGHDFFPFGVRGSKPVPLKIFRPATPALLSARLGVVSIFR